MTAVELVDQNKGELRIGRLCDLVGITPSGYYKVKRRSPSQRARADERLGAQVTAKFKRRRGRYGSPRIAKERNPKGLGRALEGGTAMSSLQLPEVPCPLMPLQVPTLQWRRPAVRVLRAGLQ